MAPLPCKPATFLVTDIVGSSQLWEDAQQAMSEALARHDGLLRELIDAHGGRVFKTVGDGVWAVFDHATSALEAALVIQETIRAESWEQIGSLAVRVALNSGEAECRDSDYFGPTVNRLSRLVKAAVGGQILASRETLQLARRDAPAHIRARAAGQLALRGSTELMDVYEISGQVEALPSGRPAQPASNGVAPSARPEATIVSAPSGPRKRIAPPAISRPMRDGPPPAVRVTMLGGFRIERDGQPLNHERSNAAKGLRLFKCLLSRSPRQLPREQAYELFWSDSKPDAVGTTFRGDIMDLRRLLEPGVDSDDSMIVTTRELVRIRPDVNLWVDADAFEQRAEEGLRAETPDLALLEDADRLYAGPYLPDDLYEDWAIRRRERLHRLWCDLQWKLAPARLQHGDPRGAISALQRLFDSDRCDERVARELMIYQARHESRAAAMQVYRQLLDGLSELASDGQPVQPEPETERVRQEILSGKIGAVSQPARPTDQVIAIPGLDPGTGRGTRSRRNQLPVQLTTLVGRTDEVVAARTRLLAPGTRLLTLVGIGGSGKSRLATQVAGEVIPSFADGVYFVDLAPTTDPALMMVEIARVLGLGDSGPRSLDERVHETIGEQELLLVLDNFEQIVEAAVHVARLLAACPRLRVLATSRIALRVSGERILDVGPLPLPAPLTASFLHGDAVTTLAENPAVRLFVERAQDAHAAFRLTQENAASIAQICHRLDGLPLALELAAARTRTFSPSALLARLAGRLDLLEAGPRDMPARQQTMRDAIAWSYGLLSPAQQALFRRLAAFVGAFTIEAVEQVCGPWEELGITPEAGLLQMVDTSLLQPIGRLQSEPRFRMLETVRTFGHEQLTLHGEHDTYERQHATYYLAFAEEAEAGLEGAEQATWIARLEDEHDNIRAVFGWVLRRGEYGIGLRLAGVLWRSWRRHGYATDGRPWLDAILPHRAEVEPEVRAKGLLAAAELACSQGEIRRAIDLCREGLAFYEASGDPLGKAQCLHVLAWCIAYDARSESGDDYRLAQTYQEECLAIQRAQGNRPGEAKALHECGEIARYLGEYDTATDHLEQALEMRRQLRDEEGVGWSHHCLGWTAYDQGQYDVALQHARAALSTWVRTQHDYGIATTCNLWARIARRRGEHMAAARQALTCIETWHLLRSREAVAYAVTVLAGLALDRRPDRYGAVRAARLLAIAEMLRDGRLLPLHRRAEVAEIEARLEALLDADTRKAARLKGSNLTPERAVHVTGALAARWARPQRRR